MDHSDTTSPLHICVAIAGSTAHTTMCAQALVKSGRFQIPWILTPSPKKIGRKQILKKNPLHQFADQHQIPVISIDKKIDQATKHTLLSPVLDIDSAKRVHETIDAHCEYPQPDFLLVVDFGYFIPQWLLALPKIAPLNIHPSELPKYRGSSPGQFALLFGETDSAISLIKMNEKLDEGDLIYQYKFNISNTWNATEYYQHAFTLICEQLPNVLAQYFEFASATPTSSPSSAKQTSSVSAPASARLFLPQQPQPEPSPTPIARRLTREDGYVEWDFLRHFLTTQHTQPSTATTVPQTANSLFIEIFASLHSWPQVISNAVRALSPWPGVWTIVLTAKGEKRMKVLAVEVQTHSGKSVVELQQVQLEGLQPTRFEEIKNQIV